MATFVQGVPAFAPKAVNFDVDFNRIERLLTLRQGMYDEGARKVKNVYDSLFNSAMLRDDNIQKRDAYLKTISNGLKNISAMDFSMPQNQETAINLFQPITNDKGMVKDMMYTKAYQTESQLGEQYRTSSDEEERKKYSDTSLKALQYKAEEFKTASANDALAIEAPRYVPNVDVLGMADKMFQDGKVSVKKDVINGGYIWSLKNGDLAVPITQSMMSTMFSQDPAIRDFQATQAYVRRKDYVKNNTGKFNGDATKAEAEYMQTVLEETVINNQMQVYKDDAEVSKLMLEVDSWDNLAKEGKILQGSDDEKKYKEAVQKLDVSKTALLQKKADLSVQELTDLKDINAMRRAVDAAVTMDSYNDLSSKLALYLAKKDSEMSVKVDPLYLADMRADNSMELAQLRFQNSVLLANLRAGSQSALEDQKHENRKDLLTQQGDQRIEQIQEQNKGKVKNTSVESLFDKTTPYSNIDSTGKGKVAPIQQSKKVVIERKVKTGDE